MKITDNYVFFKSGVLSQWYKKDMTIDGVKFTSCEQYMMYMKAKTFNDDEIADKILNTNNPAEQKQFGRQVKNFDKNVWDSLCLSIVYKGNLNKFTQNNTIKEYLLSFENRFFVEASPTDKIWGIGLDINDKNIDNPLNWRGTNLLGTVLTLVRNELM
jgi:ribA/ribD-fused uncharacterized protein